MPLHLDQNLMQIVKTIDPHVNYGHNTVDIPDVIKQFLQYFCTVISERQLFEIQDLYENT